MAGEVLTEKYRPRTFEDFIGNDATVHALKTACRRKSGPPNAILLIGPRGCGKTTLAHIIRKELMVRDLDFTELNTANVRGIDTIRHVDNTCRFAAFSGGKKIYFFDECHKLTNDAQHALLKLLESPPEHVVFILATTDPLMLIATVRSRCTTYDVKFLSSKQTKGLIAIVLKKEKITDFPQEAIDQIADASEGSAREAMVLLDKVIDMENTDDILNAIEGYSINHTKTKDLCQALLATREWKDVTAILKGIDDEPERVRYAVLSYMNKVLLNKDEPQAVNIISNFSQSFLYNQNAGLTAACYYSVMKG